MFRSKEKLNEKDLAIGFFDELTVMSNNFDCTKWAYEWLYGPNNLRLNSLTNGGDEVFCNNDVEVSMKTMSRWINEGKLVLIHLPEWKENHYEIRWHDMDYGDL